MWEDLTVAFVGFLLGLLSGIVIQSLRFSYQRKLDKIRRVMPYVETVHPILETLVINVEHCSRLQEKNDTVEMQRYLKRATGALNSFGEWFSGFAERGLKPELQSLKYDLYAGLYGIFVYYQMTKIHGIEFVSQNLEEIGTNLERITKLLEEFLKQ